MEMMSDLTSWIPEETWKRVAVAVVVCAGTLKLSKVTLRWMLGRFLPRTIEPEKYEDDTVYLFMFPRSIGKQVTNISPFGMKLETWLRLNNVKYQHVETIRFSKATQQIPYIRFQGEEFAESNFIIEHLTTSLGLDETENLTPEQLALAHIVHRMVDEATSWTYFMYRYVYHMDYFKTVFKPNAPLFMANRIRSGLQKTVGTRGHYQGIGRLTEQQVAHLARKDMVALSRFLGDKDFMMGDNITKVDCAVFGHLAQVIYVDLPYPHKDVLKNEATNIVPYMDRIKNQLYPDWNQIVSPGKFSD